MIPRILFLAAVIILWVKLNYQTYIKLYKNELCSDGFYSRKDNKKEYYYLFSHKNIRKNKVTTADFNKYIMYKENSRKVLK